MLEGACKWIKTNFGTGSFFLVMTSLEVDFKNTKDQTET